MQEDLPTALTSLERALTLAEPEGYVRIFLDEGEPMRSLIEDLRSHRSAEHLVAYVNRLLDAFADTSALPPSSMPPIENQKSETLAPGASAGVDDRHSKIENRQSITENLIEPLTERELEVLRLFKTELSGPEIARELVIGLSTVRTHTKSLYSKLGVNSRRAAVRRAEELGLI
jgi:LuxR family maltose regulon positive regulatory protein